MRLRQHLGILALQSRQLAQQEVALRRPPGPGRSSSSVTLMAAMPAAQAIGFPPNVVEWMIGLGIITSHISESR